MREINFIYINKEDHLAKRIKEEVEDGFSKIHLNLVALAVKKNLQELLDFINKHNTSLPFQKLTLSIKPESLQSEIFLELIKALNNTCLLDLELDIKWDFTWEFEPKKLEPTLTPVMGFK